MFHKSPCLQAGEDVHLHLDLASRGNRNHCDPYACPLTGPRACTGLNLRQQPQTLSFPQSHLSANCGCPLKSQLQSRPSSSLQSHSMFWKSLPFLTLLLTLPMIISDSFFPFAVIKKAYITLACHRRYLQTRKNTARECMPQLYWRYFPYCRFFHFQRLQVFRWRRRKIFLIQIVKCVFCARQTPLFN